MYSNIIQYNVKREDTVPVQHNTEKQNPIRCIATQRNNIATQGNAFHRNKNNTIQYNSSAPYRIGIYIGLVINTITYHSILFHVYTTTVLEI